MDLEDPVLHATSQTQNVNYCGTQQVRPGEEPRLGPKADSRFQANGEGGGGLPDERRRGVVWDDDALGVVVGRVVHQGQRTPHHCAAHLKMVKTLNLCYGYFTTI